MAATIEVPARSIEQRMSALAKANQIRTYRAWLKADITAGKVKVTPLIAEPNSSLLTMKIHDVLMALPHWGRAKVAKLLRHTNTSPSKTLGGLSDRQRAELIAELGGR